MSEVNLYPAPKKITVAGKELEVKKLPFKPLMEVAQLIKDIDFEKDIKTSSEKMIDTIVIALSVEKQWAESLMAEDVALAFREIISMNKDFFKKPQNPGAGPEKE